MGVGVIYFLTSIKSLVNPKYEDKDEIAQNRFERRDDVAQAILNTKPNNQVGHWPGMYHTATHSTPPVCPLMHA